MHKCLRACEGGDLSVSARVVRMTMGIDCRYNFKAKVIHGCHDPFFISGGVYENTLMRLFAPCDIAAYLKKTYNQLFDYHIKFLRVRSKITW
jgi:hypothetical protein